MTVWYRQSVDGVPGEPTPIERHAPDQADADLLAAKANGAADKGWAVTWTGERSFSAVKDRWGGSLCVRDFWTD
jgi:hypothetical protein